MCHREEEHPHVDRAPQRDDDHERHLGAVATRGGAVAAVRDATCGVERAGEAEGQESELQHLDGAGADQCRVSCASPGSAAR